VKFASLVIPSYLPPMLTILKIFMINGSKTHHRFLPAGMLTFTMMPKI